VIVLNYERFRQIMEFAKYANCNSSSNDRNEILTGGFENGKVYFV